MSDERRCDLLVKGGPVWAGPENFYKDGVLEVSRGRVIHSGPARGYTAPEAEEVLDLGGDLLMPGLINAHCHAAMVLFRGMADDLPLEEWLKGHMFPAEARWVNPDMVEACTLLASAEMLLSGTTCVLDSYMCMQGAAKAYRRSGMRAVIANGIVDFPAPGIPDVKDTFRVNRDLIEGLLNQNPRITPSLFAHSVYTCSAATLEKTAALAEDLQVDWFTHLAESRGELAQSKEQHGMEPVEFLESLGLLESLRSGAHGVWLNREQLGILADRDVALVHCPESNQKLASGAAPVTDWLEAGVTAALGTDGAASNNDLDLIGEMGHASRLAKVTPLDPAALPAARILDMALAGSAKAMGLEGEVGRLLPGYRADFMVINRKSPHLVPMFEVPSAMVFQARGADVRHVAVDGELLVRNRRLTRFDLAEAIAKVKELAPV